eukprot:TRINITY_DN65108_c0_g1_i1.p1 TRINITY_DN65108_c0_g1~~TRINITY_DN65108_c0_g1_i1.p1  ORF type:complete len:391 (-),score=58.48 TRINITY_DN65108_c0_g1_i1:197-1369(-)
MRPGPAALAHIDVGAERVECAARIAVPAAAPLSAAAAAARLRRAHHAAVEAVWALVARPLARLLILDAAEVGIRRIAALAGAGRDGVVEATRRNVTAIARKAPPGGAAHLCGPRIRRQEDLEKIRGLAHRSTISLVCACALAAGLGTQVAAQLLLLELYRACQNGWGAYVGEVILAPFVLHFCNPTEWARYRTCCRRFRRFGIKRESFASYCFSGYSMDGRVETLNSAVRRNVPAVVRLAVEARADVNSVVDHVYLRAPLHCAAKQGNADLCELLMLLRADVALRDSHGAAPIHLASSRGRLQVLDLLLRDDPDSVEVRDASGRTPCHMAALKGHLSVVQRLLRGRARPGAFAFDGRTPVDMARYNQHLALAEFMENHEVVDRRHRGAEP